MSSDEVYSLCLTTSNTNSNILNNPIIRTAGNYSDVSWLVNWDEIIPQEKIEEYKYCRVRFNLYQGAYPSYTYNNQLGYLCANFQSNFNAPTTDLPTILGILHTSINPNSGGSETGVYQRSTLDEVGVDININGLKGRQYLQLKWVNDDSYNTISNITKDWEIMLTFQLYN